MKSDVVFAPQIQKTIWLPNSDHNPKGSLSPDFKKKINLKKLHALIEGNQSFKPKYDTRSNPFQNYVEIVITGSIFVYSNGTVNTKLNLPDEALLVFLGKLYNAYMRECLEESK
jgi:hypothetical protein